MPESRFEKEVKQQMDDLLFRPSEAVWQKVEAELRRKKRRRVAILFSLLIGLGILGYSGYVMLQDKPKDFKEIVNQQKPVSGHNASEDAKDNTISQPGNNNSPSAIYNDGADALTSKDKNNIGANNDQQASPGVEKEVTANVYSKDPSSVKSPVTKNSSRLVKEDGEKKEKTSSTISRRGNENIVVRQAPGKNKTVKPGKTKTASRPVADDGLETKTATGSRTIAAQPPVQQQTGAEVDNTAIVSSQDRSVVDSADVAIASTEAITDSLEPASNITEPIVRKSKTPKLRWGFEISGGQTTRSRNPLPAPLKSLAPQADGLYAAPDANGGVPTPSIRPPSDVKAGPSFSVGGFAQLQLSKRISVTAGLRYSFQSDYIRAGEYRDTSFLLPNLASQYVNVNAVYGGQQTVSHRNEYHFIQFPLRLEWQVNKGRKLPISWNVGVTPGYLINTNALVYDTALGGIYYKDKLAYTRFHLGLNTGLSFHFGRNSRFQWSVGPEFSFDLRKLYDVTYDPRRYLTYMGINARIWLPKKK